MSTPPVTEIEPVFVIVTTVHEDVKTDEFTQPNGADVETHTSGLIVTRADHYIAAFLVLLTLAGILGNLLSTLYFWKRRKNAIHDLLYSIISVLDCLTSTTSFPVIASLLNSRDPMLFENIVICNAWPIVFYFFTRVSMLLVVFVSITRTIAIVKPFNFNNVQRQANRLVLGMMVYAVLLLAADLAFLFTGSELVGEEIRYIKHTAFCEIFIMIGEKFEAKWVTLLYQALLQLELILPCLAVLVSFLVSSLFLLKRNAVRSGDEKKFRRVSITITLFTLLFLLCYLPCFVLQMINFVCLFNIKMTIIEDSKFLQYAYLLIQFVLPLLNAAVNPCLYILRMPQYRKWISIEILNRKTHQQSKAMRLPMSDGIGEGKLVGTSV